MSATAMMLLLSIQQLAAPFETPWNRAIPSVIERPARVSLSASAGFEVNVFAERLSNPRRMALAPNGDVFVTETSTAAAKAFGLYPDRGVIREGSFGDVMILDPNLTHVVDAADDPSNSDYTPFQGWALTGWPVMTIRRGEVVYEESRVTGRAVHRELLLAVKPVTQALALDERHHVVEQAVRFSRVVKRQDVRVLEPRGRLDLSEEPFSPYDSCQLRLQDLQGDVPLVPQVLDRIHRGHAALTQLSLDAVAAFQGREQSFHDRHLATHPPPTLRALPIVARAQPSKPRTPRPSAGPRERGRARPATDNSCILSRSRHAAIAARPSAVP